MCKWFCFIFVLQLYGRHDISIYIYYLFNDDLLKCFAIVDLQLKISLDTPIRLERVLKSL